METTINIVKHATELVICAIAIYTGMYLLADATWRKEEVYAADGMEAVLELPEWGILLALLVYGARHAFRLVGGKRAKRKYPMRKPVKRF